ncbi:MAG: hypothetical protein HW416_643 [Chloroflexi bacterium]|nr:hypothetical protein [Chloroflexota bacterium]
MRWLRFVVVSLALIPAGACVPPSAPASDAAAARGPTSVDDGASKTLVLAQLNAPKLIGVWEFGTTAGGIASLGEVHSTGLVTLDGQGNPIPRLAGGIPSFDEGSIVFLPDGRMQTTWRLRSDVSWQDGALFTAEDVVFTQAVHATPELRASLRHTPPFIERIDAPDPLTAVITWKSTYYNALYLDHRSFWLMPKHLLAEALESDKDAFLGLPYFTTNYVHLGPFRLFDWGQGQDMVFERYDGYVLGRPKVGKIIIRVIPDPNTMFASLKAGAIDVITEKSIPTNLSIQLQQEWRRSGEGVVLSRQENWNYAWLQFDPQYARPLELSQDVRIRRGLLFGFDRDALREFMLPGQPDTSADTFMTANDSRAAIAGQPFARYPFDPARAQQELADAGWRRAADGRVLDLAGTPVQFELRAGAAYGSALPIIAADWRRLGLEVTEYITPPQLGSDPEQQASFPALDVRARSAGEGIFPSFDSRESATAQNRFRGGNYSHYANPALDRLIDKLYGTLDPRERGLIVRDMGELMASELFALPVYWGISFLHVRRTLRGNLEEDFPHTSDTSGGAVARNAHLWERV